MLKMAHQLRDIVRPLQLQNASHVVSLWTKHQKIWICFQNTWHAHHDPALKTLLKGVEGLRVDISMLGPVGAFLVHTPPKVLKGHPFAFKSPARSISWDVPEGWTPVIKSSASAHQRLALQAVSVPASLDPLIIHPCGLWREGSHGELWSQPLQGLPKRLAFLHW